MFNGNSLAKMKIVFFGSDEYSLIVLAEIFNAHVADIALVVTTENNQVVKNFAEKSNLPSFVWSSTSGPLEEIKKIKPNVGILASFGKIIPENILNGFPAGILNLHPSLLPKYRGSSPAQTAILNGDRTTGISIIKMDKKVDHGPIVYQEETEILPDENSRDLYLRLFSIGAKKLIKILPSYLENKIALKPQDETKVTYARKFTRLDGKIDFSQSPETQVRLIRAMQPWPGAWTQVKLTTPPVIPSDPAERGSVGMTTGFVPCKRLKILRAHLESEKLVLDEVQLEGKKPVSGKQFFEGYPEAKLV